MSDDDDSPTQDAVKPRNKVRLWLASIAAFGVLITVIGVFLTTWKAASTPSEESSERMSELGSQWAQGYLEAIRDRPRDAALNSLYGACILQMNSVIVQQYGTTPSQDWLGGCLMLTRQTDAIKTSLTGVPAAPTSTVT